MAKQRGGVLTEGKLLRRGLCREPLLFAENRENVIGAKRIFAHRMRLDVIGRGHLRILAQPSGARPCSRFYGAIQIQSVESVAITWAAMASPRPTASTPSLVLAF